MRITEQEKKWIILGIAIIFMLMIGSSIGLAPLSLISNYQGAKPRFMAVYYNDKLYTPGNCYDASTCVIDVQLNFDPDDPYDGMGNLAGEMTSIVVPQESLGELASTSWIPREWINGLQDIKNPIRVYEWKLKDENNVTHIYKMEEWKLKWFVTISYEHDSESEAYSGYTRLDLTLKRYHNVEIWFKIDLNNINWYFEGANRTYFGIAKIMLDKIKLEGLDTKIIRVLPMSSGSYLPLFKSLRGEQEANQDPYMFQGKLLNPEVFRKEVYTRIILEDFGAQIEFPYYVGFIHNIYDDAVTFEFDVYVFVVGEWDVKDIVNTKQLEESYGRSSKVEINDPFYGLKLWLGNVFANPWFGLGFTLFMITIILVIIAIFMPNLLHAINNLIPKGKRKRR